MIDYCCEAKWAAKLWRLWRPGHPFIQIDGGGDEAKAGRTREKKTARTRPTTSTTRPKKSHPPNQGRGSCLPTYPQSPSQGDSSRGCAKLRTKDLGDVMAYVLLRGPANFSPTTTKVFPSQHITLWNFLNNDINEKSPRKSILCCSAIENCL